MALLFLSVITALKINDFAPCCRPVYVALDTTQWFFLSLFCFVIDFFIRNFQNNFKPKYLPSALLFLTCSLPDLAVSIVHWQINHCQGSAPQCPSHESQTNPAVLQRSLLHSFVKACWLCGIPLWRQTYAVKDTIFFTQEKTRNKGAVQYNINTFNMSSVTPLQGMWPGGLSTGRPFLCDLEQADSTPVSLNTCCIPGSQFWALLPVWFPMYSANKPSWKSLTFWQCWGRFLQLALRARERYSIATHSFTAALWKLRTRFRRR